MITNKKQLILLLGVISLVLVSSASSYAAGVKPLVIDIEAEAGEEKEFELTLTPSGQKEEVEFSLYKPVQAITGGLKYKKEDDKKKWVSLAKEKVTVYPDQQKQVKGSVKIPFDAGGSYTKVIMVEPQQTTKKKNGLKVKVRYAVRINIRVDRPGIYPQADIVDFGLEADENKKPVVNAVLKNPSQVDYLVGATATLRDQDRRLVEQVTLKSPEGNKPKSNKTRMYPESKVKYLGRLTKRITPGNYKLRVFFKYADNGQIIKSRDIEIKKGDFALPSPEELGALTVQPEKLDLNLAAKAHKSKVLRLNNQLSSAVKVVAQVDRSRKNYPHSLANWLKLRGEQEFKLRANKRGQIILTTVVPDEVKAGSYHGKVSLKAFNPQTEEFISKSEVPITAVIGEEHDYQLEVKSLYTKPVEEGHLLSLDLLNAGAVFATPKAELVIETDEGKFIERVKATTVGDNSRILPETSERLQGLAKKLTAGNYTAEITINQAGQELKKEKIEFEVEE
jgi:hypothetical protein